MDILTATERSLRDTLKMSMPMPHRQGLEAFSTTEEVTPAEQRDIKGQQKEQAWACPRTTLISQTLVQLLTLESWVHLLSASNFMSFPYQQGVGVPYLSEWL